MVRSACLCSFKTTAKKNKSYHHGKHGNLSVLTKTNGGISYSSFTIPCVRQVESLVIQLWEPIAKVAGQTEPDSDEHPVHATTQQRKTDATKRPAPPLALCDRRRVSNANRARSREEKPTTIAFSDEQLGHDSDEHPVDTPL